jgi:spermidine synthase
LPDFSLVVFEETSSLVNPVRRYDMTIVLCAIFFVSGASSLVFENLWFRQAGLAFGNSVWASSLVLAGFMGGLALGSWTAVCRGDRLGPPVRTYAVLELAIAISGEQLRE